MSVVRDENDLFDNESSEGDELEEMDEDEFAFDEVNEESPSEESDEEDEELKIMKDPKLMTRRQRALLESQTLKKNQEAMRVKELESAKKARLQERSSLDDEDLERMRVKATRRRQQAEEKKEEDKKQTIDRLLKKKDNSQKKGRELQSKSGRTAGTTTRSKQKLNQVPKMTYLNNEKGIYIVFPGTDIPDLGLPIKAEAFATIPKDDEHLVCAQKGCGQKRKYLCSKSKLPCCSLACYKELNLIDCN
jgi:INO80 complex subunit B